MLFLMGFGLVAVAKADENIDEFSLQCPSGGFMLFLPVC